MGCGRSVKEALKFKGFYFFGLTNNYLGFSELLVAFPSVKGRFAFLVVCSYIPTVV